jgi:cytoskeletal protein CcmA (bactofilin family)
MSHPGLSGVLGAGARWEGHLSFDGRVRIDGDFQGTIRSPDLIEVGPTGHVRGEVEVAQALIAGRVDGTLRASERVTLLEGAHLSGALHTPWLDVRVGAQLDAQVHVTRGDP